MFKILRKVQSMGKFKYKATNMNGMQINGVYDAANKSAVIEMLRGKSYYPLKIEMLRERDSSLDIDLTPRLPMKDVTIFCNQMATVLRAGVPMTYALTLMLSPI